MELTPELIAIFGNYGPWALLVVILLVMYSRLSIRVMDLVEKNTKALTALQEAVKALCDRVDRRQ